MLAGVDQKGVLQAVTELYGMSLPNRASGTANYKKATEWAKAMVEAKAPAVKVTFIEQAGLRNTEIVLPGSDPAAGMYIVGGHMDSVAAGPGADDDGSGSIGTMFVAMALAKYQFKSEVRFMLFDAEEKGFVGSTQYARTLKMTCDPGTCLKLYINLDMISNDPRNRAAINVTTTDPALRALHTQINIDYMIGAMLVFGGNNCGTSDDCSFQRSGYKTIEIKEDDFSPNWHRPSDTQANQNITTMVKNIKLAAGVAASLAGIEGVRP
ncbi:MAG TPA: M28 family peptidase [Polyangia bacterium]|nr:M28 family peptidase [Polyangia bacterium]